jgi:alpha-tubulin suppressor-like RCC1 family protein
MITSIQNRATIGRVMAFGYLIATLLMAMVLSAAPTGAAVPSGKAFGWGTNDYGELDNGTNDYSNLPVAVRDLSDVKSVKAGDGHGLALLQNGTVWAWGYNNYGQLGNGAPGANAYSDVPVAVKNLMNVKNIDGSNGFTLAATQ